MKCNDFIDWLIDLPKEESEKYPVSLYFVACYLGAESPFEKRCYLDAIMFDWGKDPCFDVLSTEDSIRELEQLIKSLEEKYSDEKNSRE